MRTSVFISVGVLVALCVLATAPSASALDEMTNMTATFSPSEMDQGGLTHMAVTLNNHDNRSVEITSITVQIYEGMWYSSTNNYKLYTVAIGQGEGMIAAGSSREYVFEGYAPDFFGMCSVLVSVTGVMEGDENASYGLMSASTTINPSLTGGVFGTWLLIGTIITILSIVAVVAVLYLVFKKEMAPSPPAPACPSCGMPLAPGGTFCPRCGRKVR